MQQPQAPSAPPLPQNNGAAGQIDRAQGAMLAFLVGDALGVQVEFLTAEQRLAKTSAEWLQMSDGGPWQTLAGQPTEDGELMLLQARMLQFEGCYQPDAALQTYRYWLHTDPFSIAPALQRALSVQPSEQDCSLAALSRLVPLSILGVHYSVPQIASWAMADTALTQPSLLCQQASALYAMTLAKAIDEGCAALELYQQLQQWSCDLNVDPVLRQLVEQALFVPPGNYQDPAQPVLCALHNAIWQLLYAKSVDEAIEESIRYGGDTGSYAAIAAALLGAVLGKTAIRPQWQQCLLQCKPQEGVTGVDQPRPQLLWPKDATELAEALVTMQPADLSSGDHLANR